MAKPNRIPYNEESNFEFEGHDPLSMSIIRREFSFIPSNLGKGYDRMLHPSDHVTNYRTAMQLQSTIDDNLCGPLLGPQRNECQVGTIVSVGGQISKISKGDNHIECGTNFVALCLAMIQPCVE